MKTLVKLCLAVSLAIGLATAVVAGEGEAVTLEGSVMCAKCAMGEAEDCQDVLVVAEGDAEGDYWIVKNDVAKKFGHACQGEKPARVTGTVAEKDGHNWITPTAMEAPAG